MVLFINGISLSLSVCHSLSAACLHVIVLCSHPTSTWWDDMAARNGTTRPICTARAKANHISPLVAINVSMRPAALSHAHPCMCLLSMLCFLGVTHRSVRYAMFVWRQSKQVMGSCEKNGRSAVRCGVVWCVRVSALPLSTCERFRHGPRCSALALGCGDTEITAASYRLVSNNPTTICVPSNLFGALPYCTVPLNSINPTEWFRPCCARSKLL